MELREILSRCDHTLLKQECTWEQIKEICDDGVRYGCASVCIPPSFVKRADEYLAGKLKVCTVIGFPNGYSTTAAKCFEASDAVKNGADEIDMVINLGMAKAHNWEYVYEDIKAVVEAAKGVLVKVIIECCYLTDEEKVEACKAAVQAKADFVKTSTGFGTGGATLEDVRLMKKTVDGKALVKAAGGIRDKKTFEEMIAAGADRIGCSCGAKIMEE